MERLLSLAAERAEKGPGAVFVCIVKAEGTTPREPGTCLLALTDGTLLGGTVGGGALEQWTLAYAREVKAPSLVSVAVHGCGKGRTVTPVGSGAAFTAAGPDCQAVLQLLFAPLQAPDADALHEAKGRPGGTLHLPLISGKPLYYRPAEPGKAVALTETECLLPVEKRARVLLFGAGHVAQALCRLLPAVDFEVTVYDDRPALADEALFPGAARIVCGSFSEDLEKLLGAEKEDYIVVMTSGHDTDFRVISQYIRGGYAYLGNLGSHRKRGMFEQNLRRQGVSEEALAALRIPIGLPIGAETPAEIALCIASELVSVRAERRKAEQP